MPLPPTARSLLGKTLSISQAQDVLREVATGTFAERSVLRSAQRQLEQARDGDVRVDIVVHDGDLVVDELRTGVEPFIGVLLVRSNLVVRGLFQDCLDPESVVVVTGDLRAARMISKGLLEVHGSVLVDGDALWLDNDGCAEIHGDLKAHFIYTKYHAVRVHGAVEASLVLGDAERIEAGRPYTFVCEGDDDHKDSLRAVLPGDALHLEGDEDDPDDWCIDWVDDEVMVKLVVEGKPVLRAPWPPAPSKGDHPDRT
jgi:hypothetical protein